LVFSTTTTTPIEIGGSSSTKTIHSTTSIKH